MNFFRKPSLASPVRCVSFVLVAAAAFICAPANAPASAVTTVPGTLDGHEHWDIAFNAEGEYLLAWESKTGISVLEGSIDGGFGRSMDFVGSGSENPDAAIAPDGTRGVAWTESVTIKHTENLAVYAAVWSRGATTVQKQQLGAPALTEDKTVSLALTDGAGVATWSDIPFVNKPKSSILYSRLGPGNVFDSSRVVYSRRSLGAVYGALAGIDASGAPVLSWIFTGVDCRDDWFADVGPGCRNEQSSSSVMYGDPSGTFGAPQTFGKGCGEPLFAFAPTGAGAAGLNCRDGARFTYRAPGNPFMPSTTVRSSNRFGTGIRDVSVLPDGRVLALYQQGRMLRRERWQGRLLLAAHAPGEAFATPKPITRLSVFSIFLAPYVRPRFVVGGGQPYVEWSEGFAIKFAALSPNNQLGPVMTFSDEVGNDFGDTVIGASRSGVGVVVWVDYNVRGDHLKMMTFAAPGV